MTICPVCGEEYRDGVEICIDCGSTLVDKTDIEGKSTCSRCGNPKDTRDQYCRYCGNLFAHQVSCEVHTGTESGTACVICGRALCSRCAYEISGVSFCGEHSGYHFTGCWATISSASAEWKAQMVKDYLINNGVPCLLESNRFGATYPAVGSQAEIRLMVPFEFVLKAEEFLAAIENGG